MSIVVILCFCLLLHLMRNKVYIITEILLLVNEPGAYATANHLAQSFSSRKTVETVAHSRLDH